LIVGLELEDKNMKKLIATIFLLPSLAISQELTQFENGKVADADDINQNFTALKQRITELEMALENQPDNNGLLTSCRTSDLAGSWIGASAISLGYRGFSMNISTTGSISGLVSSPDGDFSFTGTIGVRNDCTLSSLQVSSPTAGLTVYGAGYGALARDGNTMVSTVVDSLGYSAAFSAVRLP
jgi:hypothetical protein